MTSVIIYSLYTCDAWRTRESEELVLRTADSQQLAKVLVEELKQVALDENNSRDERLVIAKAILNYKFSCNYGVGGLIKDALQQKFNYVALETETLNLITLQFNEYAN